MSKETETFWIVWCPQAGPPTVQHPSRALAEVQGKRLAQQHPGQNFYVLEAMSLFRGIEVERVTLTREIPF